MKKNILIILVMIFAVVVFLAPIFAMAADEDTSIHIVPEGCRGIALLSGGSAQETCNLDQVEELFLNVGKFILGILGSVALLFFVIGGLMYIISPAADKIASGKNILVSATIGIIIVLCAAVAINFVETTLVPSGVDLKQSPSTNQAQPQTDCLAAADQKALECENQCLADYQVEFQDCMEQYDCDQQADPAACQQSCVVSANDTKNTCQSICLTNKAQDMEKCK